MAVALVYGLLISAALPPGWETWSEELALELLEVDDDVATNSGPISSICRGGEEQLLVVAAAVAAVAGVAAPADLA